MHCGSAMGYNPTATGTTQRFQIPLGGKCSVYKRQRRSLLKNLSTAVLVGLLVICQSCATSKLWEDTDPNVRIWIDANKITEAALKSRGVKYQVQASEQGTGYLVEKSGWEKMKDYHLRMLGAPVTLVVDAATTVVVVGVYMLVNDPEGTCYLIEALVSQQGRKASPPSRCEGSAARAAATR